MRRALFPLPLLLAACMPPAPSGPTVEVGRGLGTLQCAPDPGALERVQGQLQRAGVTVLAAREGDDGMMRIALCGAPDGRIGVFTIPASQADAAAAAGFARQQAPDHAAAAAWGKMAP